MSFKSYKTRIIPTRGLYIFDSVLVISKQNRNVSTLYLSACQPQHGNDQIRMLYHQHYYVGSSKMVKLQLYRGIILVEHDGLVQDQFRFQPILNHTEQGQDRANDKCTFSNSNPKILPIKRVFIVCSTFVLDLDQPRGGRGVVTH